jgi:valyl-tRNA synthetase
MSNEIAKTYDPASIEAKAYAVWLEEKCFSPKPTDPGEPYCIVIPPPNVTGALHLGHAINGTLQDILIRNHRMRGFNALWLPGIDHAGIATQAVVEKQLREKENKNRHDVGREGLVERIWKWKQEYGDRILAQLKRLGCSCDWDRTRFTLDETLAKAVRETFFKLFRDGLVYRGKRLVNWDVHLQTSISDDEIYHETVKTNLWHIRYPIDGTDQFMIVATTRPETMLGDTAVAVHSEDSRWNWAIGKSIALPLSNRKIPIIADDILVDPKFGTGVVKVTPAHDPNDYAVWQRHQHKPDQIDLINILNPDGTINQAGGNYAGMKRDAARKKVVEDLTALGLLEKEDPYETQVGHSDRSKTPIEPYLSDQWFVKMAPLAEPALQVVRDGIIKFFPERHAQQYLSWLGEKRDWPISRQLWWGHRIPVWGFKGHMPYTAFQGVLGQLQQWAKENKLAFQPSNHDPFDLQGSFVSPHRDHEKEVVDYLESHGFVQDPDVLDTWFSSALWPHSTLGWPEKTADLAKWYPTNVLVTGRDIVTLWVARMVMMGMYNMDGKIPFHHVAINPTILDGKGERMSKSKGNGVDPVDVIDTHGADALRFTLTMMATETQDVRMPVKKDAQGRNTSDKFDIGSRFCNKIWQVAFFFVIPNLEKNPPVKVDESKWSLADRWIVSRFNRAVKEADLALEHYRFDQYAKICYDFFYGDFCDWYVEAAKPALKDSATAGQTANVLAAVLDGSLRLMHPMIPFITETIWWKLNQVRANRGLGDWIKGSDSPRLIKAMWPLVGRIDEATSVKVEQIQTTSTNIRNMQTEHQIAGGIFGLLPNATVSTESISLIQSSTSSTIQILPNNFVPNPGAASSTTPLGLIYYQGHVDPQIELQRNTKRREELTRQIQTLKGRLSNESYIAKAPPHLVKQTQDQLADAESELVKLG